MKYSSLVACLIASSVALTGAANETAVFVLGSLKQAGKRAPVVTNNEALAYFAEQLEVSDFYELGADPEMYGFLQDLQRESKHQGGKPKLIGIVHGVTSPAHFFGPLTAPSFEVLNNGGEVAHLAEQVWEQIPRQLAAAHGQRALELTPELKLASLQPLSAIVSHFEFFNSNLVSIWQQFAAQALHQQVAPQLYAINPATLRLVNDKMFINELSQLVHLDHHQNTKSPQQPEDVLIMNLKSLLSLGNKLGNESRTFELSAQVIADYFVKLSQEYVVYVVALALSPRAYETEAGYVNQRLRALDSVFKRNEGKNDAASAAFSSAGSACFTSQEDCDAATLGCNSHGACAKLSAKCWACACAPTKDTKRGKTTRWTGFDCAKKEISSEANLLFWTALSLVVFLAGGVKLLYSIGSDPLPGVLDAATTARKST